MMRMRTCDGGVCYTTLCEAGNIIGLVIYLRRASHVLQIRQPDRLLAERTLSNLSVQP
jgi:hypothetical protein